ncbi:MAG: lamin tail domain-containing protein [Myxococcales bacterium]|nr:lamin tail domain-containing protein [Myxococcales bacterium]
MRIATTLLLTALLAACSTAPPADGGSDAGDATADRVLADGPPTAVTINEIRATDEDWIELFNTGSTAVDLGNWGVTDSEADGAPRLTNVARFPAGTTVQPGQYVVVLVDQSDAGAGPQMRCLSDGGPMTCFHGTFGISATRGENVHLVAPSDLVSETVNYPMSAAAAGESWGRIPNGTGAFARNRLTPGAANLPP